MFPKDPFYIQCFVIDCLAPSTSICGRYHTTGAGVGIYFPVCNAHRPQWPDNEWTVIVSLGIEPEHVVDQNKFLGPTEDEMVLILQNGNMLACESYDMNPVGTSYIRIFNVLGEEIGYWISDEWAENPQLVMGAIMGAANS